MKLQIDTEEKTIEIKEEVQIGVFVDWMKKHIKNYPKYKIIPTNTSPFYYYPYWDPTANTYNNTPATWTIDDDSNTQTVGNHEQS